MIHYILLPTSERRALRREYRLRLVIVLLFFISLALVFGIVTMLPSYVFTYNQENEAVLKQEALNKTKKANGTADDEKRLSINQTFAQRINADRDVLGDPVVLQQIISSRSKGMTLSSLRIDHAMSTTTMGAVMITGFVATREGLLEFKKTLEDGGNFSNVQIPISDLAKSKNIDFSVSVSVNKPKS